MNEVYQKVAAEIEALLAPWEMSDGDIKELA